MIAIRIVSGVTEHFQARLSEWVLSSILVALGIVIAQPDQMFERAPSLKMLTLVAPEMTWAWVCLLTGMVRLLALVVNGTFADSAYGRFSPHVRGTLAFFSCLIWYAFVLGIWISGVNSIGIIFLTGIYVFEFFTIKEAFSDARQADEQYKHGIRA